MSTETGLPDPVVAALRSGNKIEAIKLLRARTGIGLREAKQAVEASGIEPDIRAAPGEVKSRSLLGWIVIAVVLLAAAWHFLR